jgi:aminoglycoside phosphotransferase (APT) family kinase protein
MTTVRPWLAEDEVTTSRAARLIRSQFPTITAAEMSVLGQGWDNVAMLVDRRFVFRFPRKASAATLIEAEARVLPRLSVLLPLPIPVPEWLGEPSEDFPWPFTGYRLIPGRTACQARLSGSSRIRSAPVLARFLAGLHSIEPDGLALPGDVLDRGNFASRLPLLAERLESLQRHGVVDGGEPWLRLFEHLDSAERGSASLQSDGTGGGAIVHGDLYARHLLVDDSDTLTGVIDWGDVHTGDVAMDLMVVYGFLPAAARPAFMREYGSVDEGVLRRARLRAAFHAVSFTWYAFEAGDRDLADEGLIAMGLVLED